MIKISHEVSVISIGKNLHEIVIEPLLRREPERRIGPFACPVVAEVWARAIAERRLNKTG